MIGDDGRQDDCEGKGTEGLGWSGGWKEGHSRFLLVRDTQEVHPYTKGTTLKWTTTVDLYS